MTDQEIQIMYNDMKAEFGDHLPNFEHSPIQFAYYVKLFKFIKHVNIR